MQKKFILAEGLEIIKIIPTHHSKYIKGNILESVQSLVVYLKFTKNNIYKEQFYKVGY